MTTQNTRNSKLKLPVRRKHTALPSDCGHSVIVKGRGTKKPNIPADLTGAILKQVDQRKLKTTASADVTGSNSVPAVTPKKARFLRTPFGLIKPVAIVLPNEDPDLSAMVSSASAYQKDMMSRQFEWLVDKIMDNRDSVARQALLMVPAETRKGVADHVGNLEQLRAQLSQQLPQAIIALAKANPGAPSEAILMEVLKAVQKEIGGFLAISDLLNTAFLQWNDPTMQAELRAMTYLMKEQFRLFITGSMDSQDAGAKTAPGIPTTTFTVRDAILCAFVGRGLATIPGNGPIGLHTLLSPADMRGFWSTTATLLNHEGVHQVIPDVPGLLEEMQRAVQNALLKAFRSGELKLTTETVQIGRFKNKTIDLLVKIYTDWINETVADVFGGVLNAGPAFGMNFLQTFPALGIRKSRVEDADQLLRTSSVFSINVGPSGEKELEVEEHPIDYVRAHLNAAAYEEIGFGEFGKRVRKIADSAVGKVPEFCTWDSSNEKSDTSFKVATADLLAACPIVVKTLIRTKFVAANNLSIGSIVMWNERRQKKVDAIEKLLRAGKSDLPTDLGDLYANYIFAAAAQATWNVAAEGGDFAKFYPECGKNAVIMVNKLADQQQRKAAVA